PTPVAVARRARPGPSPARTSARPRQTRRRPCGRAGRWRVPPGRPRTRTAAWPAAARRTRGTGASSFAGPLLLSVACFRQAPGLAQRIAQHVLDLGVQAAQLVVGPALRRRDDLGIDAQRIGLLFGHVSTASLR